MTTASASSLVRRVTSSPVSRSRRSTGTPSPACSSTCRQSSGASGLAASGRRSRARSSAATPAGCTTSVSLRAPLTKWCARSARRASPSARASSWRSRSAPTSAARGRSTPRSIRPSPRSRSSASTTSSARKPRSNILAFRFANGLFEPIWNRDHIDQVQIDVPETLDVGMRAGFYEATGAYRDMVVTHLFQVLAFMAMEPPAALEPRAIAEEKNKVFRSLRPIEPVPRRSGPVRRVPRRTRSGIAVGHRDLHRAAL